MRAEATRRWSRENIIWLRKSLNIQAAASAQISTKAAPMVRLRRKRRLITYDSSPPSAGPRR